MLNSGFIPGHPKASDFFRGADHVVYPIRSDTGLTTQVRSKLLHQNPPATKQSPLHRTQHRSVLIPANDAALCVPVPQHDSFNGFAINLELVDGGPMGVSV